jgi:hypothetical protein
MGRVCGDVEVSQISKQDIEDYLFYLRTEYVPHRFGGDTHALAPKTLRNVYVTLASFFFLLLSRFRRAVSMLWTAPRPLSPTLAGRGLILYPQSSRISTSVVPCRFGRMSTAFV